MREEEGKGEVVEEKERDSGGEKRRLVVEKIKEKERKRQKKEKERVAEEIY